MQETTVVPRWDLSDLYAGIDDPDIDATIDQELERAKQFQARYRGKINSPDLSAALLSAAIREYEGITQRLDKPLTYASLVFAADTSDPKHGALLQRVTERTTEVSVALLFFDLELLEAPEEVICPLLSDPAVQQYRHFIQSRRLFREHHLSEPEERILEEKAVTSSRAFMRLFGETVSAIRFPVTKNGATSELTEQEVLALLRDPDREVRRAAASGLTQGLSSNSRILTFIFNTLFQDKAIEDRLRRFEYPEQSRHLGNELSPEIVETVVTTATDNYELVARYYRLKREILGYDELWHYDRYAPLFKTRRKVTFEDAKRMVLDSFEAFSPVMARAAREFFDRGWIDAEVRPGKRGGAFCSYVTPDLHPYVFVNYLERPDDVMTLGHELGHGVHASLSRVQSYLNFHSTLPVAELASTFGEMLVFERLQSQADLEDRLALYAEKIEGVFATVFRQAAMYRFEQDAHRMRRTQGELTTDQLAEIWQRRLQEMFGDSLKLGDEHKFWWLYVTHFIHAPFYVYAYSFGELLVLSMYARYREEGSAFAEPYLEILRLGGSLAPSELLGRVGIDISDPAFWRGGIRVLAGLIEEFESLYRRWRA